LESYEEIDDSDNQIHRIRKPYYNQAEELTKNKSTTMYINFKHLTDMGNLDFLEAIYREFFLYEKSLKKAIYNFIYKHFPEYARNKLFYVSFYNLHEVEDIRHLKTDKLGRLI
jgi:DNA replication licensing factor MCM6